MVRTWQEFGDVVCSPLDARRQSVLPPEMLPESRQRTCTMTQQSLAVLCLATSAPVKSFILTV